MMIMCDTTTTQYAAMTHYADGGFTKELVGKRPRAAARDASHMRVHTLIRKPASHLTQCVNVTKEGVLEMSETVS